MRKIKVIVREQNILELCEDASCGDIIDLTEITTVDSNYIKSLINKEKDIIYKEQYQKELEFLKIQHSNDINAWKSKYNDLLVKAKLELDSEIVKLEAKHKIKISELINENREKFIAELNLLKQRNFELESKVRSNDAALKDTLEREKNRLETIYTKEMNDLEIKFYKVKEGLYEDFNKEKYEMIDRFEKEKNELNDKINILNRAKSSLNVKMTGEDLEAWCDNEAMSYMQNGLLNCTWKKDNVVVKENGETKGSKADFIFKVYKDNHLIEEDLLTSVCLEMKDENPLSKDKQENSKHFKKLDENRKKKQCKYALLVSNLELDKPNDLPIYKVREYEDMYVVRPAYMMVLLNLIASLTLKFANILIMSKNETIDLEEKEKLLNSFENLKTKYLEKPLDNLKKQLDLIIGQTESITKAANKINESVYTITNSYISDIQNNLANYELKLNKEVIKKLS